MYTYQNRGRVERYYNKEKIDYIKNIQCDAYNEYRRMWDDSNQRNKNLSVPLEVMVELTSWCNYKCKMCLKNFETNTERYNMSIDLVKKIANESQKMKIASFWIGAGSECLIHPKIKEVLELLFSVQTLDSTLLTNGSCLDEDISRILIDKKVKNLSVSLDATRDDTYKEIRGGNLSQVEKNINNFLKIRGDNLYPLLRVSMVKMKENIDQREEFLKKWEGKADIIDYQSLVTYGDNKNVSTSKLVNDCLDPFKRLYVNYDGSIYPCCTLEFQKGHYLGNVKNITLNEAWNCDKIINLREELRTGNLSENCTKCRINTER